MSTCTHSRTQPELPCPWPDCAAGTPQRTLVLMRGEQGALQLDAKRRLEVVADEGCELYRRVRNPDGWTWKRETA